MIFYSGLLVLFFEKNAFKKLDYYKNGDAIAHCSGPLIS